MAAQKLYRKLRARMWEMDIDQSYLSAHIDRSRAYVSDRFVGRNQKQFNLEDIYKIAEVLQIPEDEILSYFPRRGEAPQVERMKRYA